MLSQSAAHDNARNASVPQSSRYSREDLQTIYEIISLATLVPSEYAFRCIWRAYETVLRYRRIDPAHDSKYFRVLINLGGGGNLYAKFRDFLQQNGFDVSTVNFLKPPSQELVSLYKKTRYKDAKERRDKTVTSDHHQSDESIAESELTPPEPEVEFAKSRKEYDDARRKRDQEARKDREIGKGPGSDDSAGKGTRIFAKSLLPSDDTVSEYEREKVTNGVEEDESVQLAEDTSAMINDPVPRTRSPATREAQGRALLSINALRLRRKYFYEWHDATIKLRVHRNWLENQALNHYRSKRLPKYFKDWVFAAREIKTENARHIFLVGAAFAKWAHQTAAIINRTNEMRQRIIARKYFNAWREIVLEKEQKARLFFQAGALYRWREELSHVQGMETHAEQYYEINLRQKYFWVWWYRACEAVAPERHNEILLRQAWASWQERLLLNQENDKRAVDHYRTRLYTKVFQFWLKRTDTYIEMEEDAIDHREWSLTRRTLETLRRQAQLNPGVYQMETVIDRRIVSNTFRKLRLRACQSVAANEFRKENLLKTTFRRWNLHLRHNIMSVQVEDRIMLDALYSWVLQVRLKIFRERVRNYLLGQAYFFAWRKKCREVLTKRRIESAQAKAVLKHHIYYDAFRTWRIRLEGRSQLERQAEVHYNRTLVQKYLRVWSRAYGKTQKLSGWADDARYYLLGTATIRRWKQALKIAKRNRMRELFAAFVHKRKRGLSHEALKYWHARTATYAVMEQSASDFDFSRIQLVATGAFHVWQDRLYEINSLPERLQEYRNLPLLRQHFNFWREYTVKLTILDKHAESLHAYRDYQVKTNIFRKWRLAVFIRKTRETSAELMYERNQKKLMQAFLVLWLDRLEQERSSKAKLARSLDRNYGDHDNSGLEDDIINDTAIRDQTELLISLDATTVLDRASIQRVQTPDRRERDEGEDWLPPLRQTTFTTSTFLQTPSARATRARDLMLRLTPAQPTTPAGSPMKRFSGRSSLRYSAFPPLGSSGWLS